MSAHLLNAAKELEAISNNNRDQYFASTIDFLKFTTTFSLGFFAFIFVTYTQDKTASPQSVGAVIVVGLFVTISTLLGLIIVYNILSFWNLSWRLRSAHKNALMGIVPGMVTVANQTDHDSVSKGLEVLKKKETSLALNIPNFLFVHVVGIIFSISIYVSITIISDPWPIAITLICSIIALVYLRITNRLPTDKGSR